MTRLWVIMMKFRTFIYSLKEGIKSLKRNKAFTLASIATIMACLFLLGIFYFMICNVRHAVKQAEKSVAVVTVFFEENTSKEQKDKIKSVIMNRPEYHTIKYISAEEAWETFKEDTFNGDEQADKTFGDDNPLKNCDSYEVKLRDISKQAEFVDFLKTVKGVGTVKCSQDFADGLTTFNNIIAYVAVATMLLLLCVSVFLISITVQNGVNVRLEEITIMKLIGATDAFIKAPFIFEGMVIGLIGAILPLAMLYPTYETIVEYFMEKFGHYIPGSMSFMPSGQIFGILVPISLGVGIGIGLIGTWLTLKRKLSKIY